MPVVWVSLIQPDSPDGIAVDLLDPEVNRPLLEAIQASGVALVLFDSESPEDLAIPGIGNDFHEQASRAAHLSVDGAPGSTIAALYRHRHRARDA